MATTKQKRVAKLIIDNLSIDKPLNGGEMLEKVGYSEGIQKYPSRVLDSEGVQEELRSLGFHEDNAKRVVGEILDSTEEQSQVRLKAAEMVFKVKGSFAPEKSIVVNVDAPPTDRLKTLAEKLNADSR